MSSQEGSSDISKYSGKLWRPFVIDLILKLDIEGLSVKFDVDEYTYIQDDIIAYQSGPEVHLLPEDHSFWKRSHDPNVLKFTVFAHECFHVHQWKCALQKGGFERGSNITSNWINTEAGIQFSNLRSRLTFKIFIFDNYDDVECAALLFEVRVGAGVLTKIGRDLGVMIGNNGDKEEFIKEVSFLMYYFDSWFEEYYPWLNKRYPVSKKWQLREL